MNEPSTSFGRDGIAPSCVRTRSGLSVELSAHKWKYRDGVQSVSLNLGEVAEHLSDEIFTSFSLALRWYVENASPAHASNMFNRFLHLSRFLFSQNGRKVSDIGSAEILNYRAMLPKERAWYLNALRGFLMRWNRLGYAGVEGAASALSKMRLQGNPKGVAVLTMDPIKGPFTNLEVQAIECAIDRAFSAGELEEEDYLLSWLFMGLGQRAIQYAALKVSDLQATTSQLGDITYVLQVPRAKQRNDSIRSAFTQRKLIPQLGAPLAKYADKVRERFQTLLEDPNQAPLFPARDQTGADGSMPYHMTPGELSKGISRVLGNLNAHSERTGKQITITSHRFRRTLGTRAAQEGRSELVIAALLDHSSTGNVGVYVASVPEIAARIDKAIATQLAPLAQAFQGVLIKDESEAKRGGDPSSRIRDMRFDQGKKGIGSCGQCSSCEFLAPVACYTCVSFQPWLDGPHEAVLDLLIKQRQELLESTDERIAAINDRTILAVAEVIKICAEERELDRNTNG